MNHRRPLLAIAAVVLGLAAALLPSAPAAYAVPPGNDDIAGATAIGPLPFHHVQDTTEATTSAEETAANSGCGAPKVDHGVWFTATAAEDAFVIADVTESDYSAGIIVLSGEPGNLALLTCGPGTVSGPVTAGETVYLMIFGDGGIDGGAPTSGQLVLDVFLTPPPPTIDVTIDPRGTVDKDGAAHVSGTVTCTSEEVDALLFDVSGQLRQRVGRGFVDGFFFSEQSTPCDGVTRVWSAQAVSEGKFAGGRTATAAFAFACGEFSCGDGYAEATIQLSRRGK